MCDAVDLPVNVLAWPGLTVAEIFGAGAQRISVGGRFAWVAVGALAARRGRDARPRHVRRREGRLAQLRSTMRSASAEWRRRPSARADRDRERAPLADDHAQPLARA